MRRNSVVLSETQGQTHLYILIK